MYDNTVSAREYLSYIAEQAGGFACIGRDGKLYIRSIGQDISSIDLKLFKDFAWGEQYKVSRVAYEDGVQDFKFGNQANNTLWINSNNMYIVDSNQVENIYTQMKDFESHSFEGTTIIDPALDLGDIVVIDGKKVVYQGDLEYSGKFVASIKSTIQSKAKEETTRTVISTKTQIRRVQSEINQIDGIIRQVAQEQNEQGEKISKQEITMDGITQEVSKKVGEEEIGTKIEQNAESVRIAWNKISDFIQFVNAQLQIRDNQKRLLMALDKLGQHFFKESGEEIGDIGLVDGNRVAFAVKNEQGNMSWGIKYTDKQNNTAFYPVFSFTGKMVTSEIGNTGYAFDGFFDFDASIRLFENKIYFVTEEGPYIQGNVTGNVRIVLNEFDSQLGFSVENTNGDKYFNIDKQSVVFKFNNTFVLQNPETLEFFLRMYPNNFGQSVFDFNQNIISNIDRISANRITADNLPNSDNIYTIDGTPNSSFRAHFRQGGSVTIYSNSSDKRLKKNIKNSNINALDRIRQIKHRKFVWKKDNKEERIGYVAQELEEIDPNYIHKTTTNQNGKENYDYQVNILSVLATATKAIQELNEKVNSQQKELDFLKSEVKK